MRGVPSSVNLNPENGKEVKRLVKKVGLIGTILSISILLTMIIFGPSAIAATPVDGGDLLSQVQSPGCNVVAIASDTVDHDVVFISNPIVVTVDWILDKQCTGAGYHDFYLNVTNIDTDETDEDEDYLGSSAGPDYQTGSLTAQVDGSVNDQIVIYIYVNVAYGMNFAEDSDNFTITLI